MYCLARDISRIQNFESIFAGFDQNYSAFGLPVVVLKLEVIHYLMVHRLRKHHKWDENKFL